MVNGKHKKRIRRLLIILSGLILLPSVVVVTFYLSVVYVPIGYNPEPLTQQEQKYAEALMWKKDEVFRNYMGDMRMSTPLKLDYEEDLINALLLHEEANYYLNKIFGQMNGIFGRPQINIEPDGIKVMGQVNYKDWNVIMTLTLMPRITTEGDLNIALIDVKTGLVSLPDKVIDEILTELNDALAEQKSQNLKHSGTSGTSEISLVLEKVNDIIDRQEFTVEPEFRAIDNRYARITEIELADEHISITFLPVTKSH